MKFMIHVVEPITKNLKKSYPEILSTYCTKSNYPEFCRAVYLYVCLM